MPTKKKSRRKVANPRVGCGSVSKKRNKYVGATISYRGETRRVIGCATKVGSDEAFYATRKPGSKGTRYTPVKKRALRDLKSRNKKAVKLAKRPRGTTHTSAKLLKAWEARYGVKKTKARKKAVKNPAKRGKLTGAKKAAFLARMAKGRRAAARRR